MGEPSTSWFVQELIVKYAALMLLHSYVLNFSSEQNSCVEPIAKDSLGKVNVLASKYWAGKRLNFHAE